MSDRSTLTGGARSVGCAIVCAALLVLGCAGKEAVHGGGGTSGTGGTGGAGGSSGSGGSPIPGCGNKVVDPGEKCDDGNTVASDGCENDCTFTCDLAADGNVACGDGNLCNGDETCTDQHTCMPGTNAPNGTPCGAGNLCLNGECISPNQQCGDSTRSGTEECDDGNMTDGDGCDTDCTFSCSSTKLCDQPADGCQGAAQCNMTTHRCEPSGALGDGTLCPQDPGRVCFQGVCTSCGNGTPDTGEECDDGNFEPGDGCEPTCMFSCVPTDATRDCGQSNPCLNSGTCDTTTHTCTSVTPVADATPCGTGLICINGTCRPSACHDTIWDQVAEECDDTNNDPNDGCESDCTHSCNQDGDCAPRFGTPPTCRTWQCQNDICVDIADTTQNGNACDVGGGAATCVDGACTTGTCGNAQLNPGEICDWGSMNGTNGGCGADCTPSCSSDAECDNGDSCDGVETCQDISLKYAGVTAPARTLFRCSPKIVQNDTTSCGSSGEECFAGVCRKGFCGDGFTDATAGEECDPPWQGACTDDCKALVKCDYNGFWALKNSIPVTWAANGPLIEGSGSIDEWVLLRLVQSGTDLDIEFRVCGLTNPDFVTNPNLGSETYGTIFPDALWDSGTVPTTTVHGTIGLTPGSTLSTSSVGVVIGATMQDRFGLWPEDLATFLDPSSGITLTDPDQDGYDGITTPAKSGLGYSDIIVNILEDPDGRSNEMHLAVRQISSQTGTVETCDRITGDVDAEQVNIHVIGCVRSNGAAYNRVGTDCVPAEYTLADRTSPEFMFEPGTSIVERIKTGTPSCALVRSMIP